MPLGSPPRHPCASSPSSRADPAPADPGARSRAARSLPPPADPATRTAHSRAPPPPAPPAGHAHCHHARTCAPGQARACPPTTRTPAVPAGLAAPHPRRDLARAPRPPAALPAPASPRPGPLCQLSPAAHHSPTPGAPELRARPMGSGRCEPRRRGPRAPRARRRRRRCRRPLPAQPARAIGGGPRVQRRGAPSWQSGSAERAGRGVELREHHGRRCTLGPSAPRPRGLGQTSPCVQASAAASPPRQDRQLRPSDAALRSADPGGLRPSCPSLPLTRWASGAPKPSSSCLLKTGPGLVLWAGLLPWPPRLPVSPSGTSLDRHPSGDEERAPPPPHPATFSVLSCGSQGGWMPL